jgi:hypothetical protein
MRHDICIDPTDANTVVAENGEYATKAYGQREKK